MPTFKTITNLEYLLEILVRLPVGKQIEIKALETGKDDTLFFEASFDLTADPLISNTSGLQNLIGPPRGKG